MEIRLAKTAGFCFGVDRAIRMALHAASGGGRVYTFGDIIHNRQAQQWLETRGVHVAEDLRELTSEDALVIRAHGVGSDVFRQLSSSGVQVMDATCPYVKKIHDLVAGQSQKGHFICVVGDPNHPEVRGILGWCGSEAAVVDGVEAALLLEVPAQMPVTVVAQTTYVPAGYEEVVTVLKKRFANVLNFDTICTATVRRQSEAAKMAREVDAMVVIGGRNSSNTQKLFGICRDICPETILIETAEELRPFPPSVKMIGITAGASTPEWVIKEVVQGMEDMNKQVEGEMSFSEAFEQTMTQLSPNTVVTGKIIGYNNNEVFVDLGYKADGIIPMDEFLEQEGFDPETDLKEGAEITALIMKINDGDGNVQLSKKKVDTIRGLEIMEDAFENRTPVEAIVKEVVKGGLVADFKGIRVFIPASQVSDRFVKDLSPYVGRTVAFRITELVRNKRRVVGSCRVIIEETKAKLSEEFWSNIEIGKEYTGTVKSLTKFGAFVDLGAVDGLIHISELSWKKISDPSEVLSIGDVVNVRILNFDPESKKLSLGYRRIEDNPWYDIDRKYQAGDIVAGQVIRIVPFGAFVELEPGVEGLVHISQISSVRIGRAEEVLHAGMNVEMKILEVNSELKKISLSIREVAPIDPPHVEEEGYSSAPQSNSGSGGGYSKDHAEDFSNTIGDILGDQK